MPFVLNDGGRAAAGFKGSAGDCGTRAIAIATGLPYAEAYVLVNAFGATERQSKKRRGRTNARTGVHNDTMRRIMAHLGWEWIPTMRVGEGCKVHMRADELPSGSIIVNVSKHFAAVINGVLHDNHDCSRGGTRCVYGYWRQA